MTTDMAPIAQEDLPPTEYLIMETLAARHRLGEHGWTFPNNIKARLSSLADRGLIGFKSATVCGYQLAWLTDAGRACCLSDAYKPPARPDLTAHEDLLASVWLYIPWRYVTRQLTTEQKDQFADAVDASGTRLHDGIGEPSKAERWWGDGN